MIGIKNGDQISLFSSINQNLMLDVEIRLMGNEIKAYFFRFDSIYSMFWYPVPLCFVCGFQ